MEYNNFVAICQAIGIGAATPQTSINEIPPLTARYRAAGGGFEESIVVLLKDSVHVTLFQSSWDGTITLTGNDGDNVDVGPHSLHLTVIEQPTNTALHWFFVVESDGSLRSLSPDIGDNPTDKVRLIMNLFMAALHQYLFSGGS